MVKLAILAFVILFLVAISFGADSSNLTCQYRFNSTEQVEKLNVYDKATDQFVTNTITPSEFEEGYGVGRFKIYNNYDVPLTIRLRFKYDIYNTIFERSNWQDYDNEITIQPRDFQTISIGGYAFRYSFDKASFKITFKENNWTTVRYEKVDIVTEHCQICNGAVCLNDGTACTSDIGCGGGYCVRGACTSDRVYSETAKKEDEIKAQEAMKEAERKETEARNIQLAQDEARRNKDSWDKLLASVVFVIIGGMVLIIIVIIAFLIWRKIETERTIKKYEEKQKELESMTNEIDRLVGEYNLAKLEMKESSKKELLKREKCLKEIRGLESIKNNTIDEIGSLKQRLRELGFEVFVKEKCNIPTKKGEYVQSKGEQLISDFLYENDIDYEYDKKITLKIRGLKKWVRPDFYLNEPNIVIEYWGMKGKPDYDNKMNEKKRLYKESKVQLISIEADDLDNINHILKIELKRLGCNTK